MSLAQTSQGLEAWGSQGAVARLVEAGGCSVRRQPGGPASSFLRSTHPTCEPPLPVMLPSHTGINAA